MTFQSFILLALLIVNTGVGAVQIRSPSHHSHFSKRATLKNNNNGPCITAASASNGAAVVVGSCSGSWTLPSSGSGMIHFGNKCLDVTNGKNVNGNKLQLWDCTNGPNQKFALTNGQIQWKGTDKCLDLTNGKTSAGTQIQLWQCANGNTNQKWGYPAPSSPPSSPPSGGSPPSSGGGGGGSKLFDSKILLAYPDGNLNELLGLKPANVYYNWRATADGISADLAQHDIDHIPQLWGWTNKGEFDNAMKTFKGKLVFGHNEPNEKGQSNMSPESGIELWKQSIKPLRERGIKACSPATSGNPNGLTWMKEFSSKGGADVEFDCVAVHFYDTTVEKYQKWLQEWHAMYPNLPVVVTEFAPQNFNGGGQPSTGDCWNFYEQAIAWSLEQDWIAAIAPYGFMRDLNINQNAKLLNSDGTPNSLGKFILSHA